MSAVKWNETGRVWEEDHGLLDDEQVALCKRADVGETLGSPVPTRMISNGEYMPAPQTPQQKQVEARIAELAKEHFAGMSVQTVVKQSRGPIASDIVEVAKEQNADMIVIATHGRTGFQRFMLGSIAEKVIQYAAFPVLVVPIAHRNEKGEGPEQDKGPQGKA